MTNKPTLDPVLLKAALDVAQKAAKNAETVIKKYYQGGELSTEVKGDLTPVTVADKACETVIREIITESFPEHGIFGEEFGRSDKEDSDYLWLIDPIDGTKSFVREYPFFSTQIALMYRDEIVMGVSNAPLFDEMAWATKGCGAFLNNVQINVSDELLAHSSCISTGNIQTLINNNWQRLGHLLGKFSKIRGYGDFYHYHLLAAGKIDLIVESDVNILDIAALSLIVKESGGVMSDLSGKPIDLNTTSVLAGTTETHALGLELLNE